MKNLFLIICILFYNTITSQKIVTKNELEAIEEIAKNDIKKAIKYCDSLLKFDFKGRNSIISKNGYLHIRASKYDKARIIFKNVIDNYEQNEDYHLIDAYIGYGQSSSLSGFKNEALTYALKAYKLSEKLDLKGEVAQSLSLLSYIYFSSKDYNNAIKYAKKSIVIQKKENNIESITSLYNNIGVFYEKLNKLDSTQFYNLKSLKINKALGDDNRIAISHNNIATVFKKKGNFKKAIEHYTKSINIHTKVGSNNISAHLNLAKLFLKLDKNLKAKKLLNETIKIAKSTGDIKTLEEIYSNLLKIAIFDKDFTKSSLFQSKRDSIYIVNIKRESEENLQMLTTQFNQTKQEETLKQKIAINKKNTIISSIIGAFALLLGLFFLQRFRNNQLKLEKDKLILEQKVLRSQMNPHFIFNSLTSIQKNLLDNDLLKSSKSLSKFAKLIRQNFEFTSKELIGLDEDLDALKNYIETQQMRFEDKFDYQINIEKNIDLSFIKIPPLLLQPFVENAIEHGLKPKKEKGNLIITILENNDLLNFEIIDDGVGYKKIEKVNDREHATDIFLNRLKLRGLNEEKSFSITSENGKGTKITFSLKL
ncbi:MAG: tetratricopeptide repeat protein [Flavobacteriaceae bacterium]